MLLSRVENIMHFSGIRHEETGTSLLSQRHLGQFQGTGKRKLANSCSASSRQSPVTILGVFC